MLSFYFRYKYLSSKHTKVYKKTSIDVFGMPIYIDRIQFGYLIVSVTSTFLPSEVRVSSLSAVGMQQKCINIHTTHVYV